MNDLVKDFYGEHYEYAKMATNSIVAAVGIAESHNGIHLLARKAYIDEPSSKTHNIKDVLMNEAVLHVDAILNSKEDIPEFISTFGACLYDYNSSIVSEADFLEKSNPSGFYGYYLTIQVKSDDPKCSFMNVEVRISTPTMDCIGALENCIKATSPFTGTFAEASRILAMYKD